MGRLYAVGGDLSPKGERGKVQGGAGARKTARATTERLRSAPLVRSGLTAIGPTGSVVGAARATLLWSLLLARQQEQWPHEQDEALAQQADREPALEATPVVPQGEAWTTAQPMVATIRGTADRSLALLISFRSVDVAKPV